MKTNINLIGYLSIALMACVFIIQGGWLYNVYKMKTDEFCQNVSFLSIQNSENHFYKEFFNICDRFGFTCSLMSDRKTLIWGIDGDKRRIELSNPLQEYNHMSRIVTYDFLYENELLDLQAINSAYRKVLREKGISQVPILLLQDSKTKEILMTTDSSSFLIGKILTAPINVGHDYKHELIAAFNQPSVFRSMAWHLIAQISLFLCFVYCVVWQWLKMKAMHHSAKVQTMGIAHLEHEIKKPLSVMISSVSRIVEQKNEELTEPLSRKLKRMKVRLKKMLEVIETMLIALKSSRLKVERVAIDIQQEMGLIVEMFAFLEPSAKVDIQIEEGADKALLDNVYFTCLVTNLVDNAIKYCENSPEVKIWFGKEGTHWMLKVTDNGIGISSKDQKQIFQQFYRAKDNRVTKKTGIGLGLVFVKKIVDAYGGEVKVQSELGQGSCFKIKFK